MQTEHSIVGHTKVERNLIHEIGNRPAYEILAETFNELAEADQKKTRGNLFIQENMGPLGLAGFFCNGEIGPVGERNFLHGYTASLALFLGTKGGDSRSY